MNPYQKASQLILPTRDQLSIPGNPTWTDFVNRQVSSLTSSSPDPGLYNQLAALVVLRTHDSLDGRLAATLYSHVREGLINAGVPQPQVAALDAAVAQQAKNHFPSDGPGVPAARSDGGAYHAPVYNPRTMRDEPPPPPAYRAPLTGNASSYVAPPAPMYGPPPAPMYVAPPAPMYGPPPAQYAPPQQQYRPAAPPVQVINQGVADMQRKAAETARRVYSGSVSTLNWLMGQRQLARQGDWMAKQRLTYIQAELNRQGQDPTPATWAGESAETVYAEQNIAMSLVRRAAAGDQVADATLNHLDQGNNKARRIAAYALQFKATGSPVLPSFGAAARRGSPLVKPAVKVSTARPTSTKGLPLHQLTPAQMQQKFGVRPGAPSPLTRPAPAAQQRFAAPVAQRPLSPAQVATQQGQRHAGFRPSTRGYGVPVGGGGSGTGNSGGQDQSGSMNPSAGDQGLNQETGQNDNQAAANLVNAARSGDPKAKSDMTNILRSARAGDPTYQSLAQAIESYTQSHPEFAGELVGGHATNLSHSHPLTQKRVGSIAATFGAEAGTFMAHVRSPYGPVAESMPAFTGQIVGRAQAIQAARFPNGDLGCWSPRAANELSGRS